MEDGEAIEEVLDFFGGVLLGSSEALRLDDRFYEEERSKLKCK